MYFKKNYLLILFYIFVILLFTKIDYRLIEEFVCCQDDHDYYSHTETIAIDFDLNYSNQFNGFEKQRYYQNGVVAPKGFIGSGLLASPFLYIGNIFEKNIDNSNIFNFKILFYSLSAIFYFFMSILLTNTSLRLLNIKINLHFIFLLFVGSGVSYYAFERYSMTHVYEVFTISLLIFIITKFYTAKDTSNYFSFLIPIATFLAISVRWVNYHVFFIPFLIRFLFKDQIQKNNHLMKNKYFYLSYVLSAGAFLLLNKSIYSIYTFNPTLVYGSSGRLNSFFNVDFIGLFSKILISVQKILFSEEFGIFWFSPIIFAGLLILFFLLCTSGKSRLLGYAVLLFVYGIPFGSVIIWQSTASSYGYRYLFSLLPISILIFGKWKVDGGKKLINYYLLSFSIFSSLSILFFETTPGTSLSQNINSFNTNQRFSQPDYLSNYILSYFEVNPYLIIFTTSFLGVLLFKMVLTYLEVEELNNILENFNLPVNNPDYINYIDKIDSISFSKILFFTILLNSIVLHFISQDLKMNKKSN